MDGSLDFGPEDTVWGRNVAVVGHPGVGCSTLAAEMADRGEQVFVRGNDQIDRLAAEWIWIDV